MNNEEMSIDSWVQLFKDTGLTDDMMNTWHALFEKRFPEVHQSFLEWLGLPEARIQTIRTEYSQ